MNIQYLQKNWRTVLQFCKEKSRIFLLLTGCIACMQSQSQSDKNLVLADQYFAAGDYFTAAGLYEQFLHPAVKQKAISDFPLTSKRHKQGAIGKPVDKLDVLYKQAESYRLSNYWPQASLRYKECFKKDQAKYAAGLYWYAACQRSIGNYKEAEEALNSFLESHDIDNAYRLVAKKELETLKFIKHQLTKPDSILFNIQKINTSFGTEKGIYAPAVITETQFLITSTQIDSVVKPGVNPYHNRLFYSSIANGNLQNMELVNIDGVDVTLNQGAAGISANGNYLYFTQWKKEKGQTISAIYYSSKKENGWSVPVLLPLVNQEIYNSKQPFCSSDGKYLFFASDRAGGSGGFDIWYASLQADGTTGEPVNAGTTLNTAADEQSPFYHGSSGTLVFSSNRMPGMGGYDLFAAKGWQTEWEIAENMGHPINSSRDDLYFFAPQNETLLNNAIISSDRGSDCCLETYVVNKAPKKKMLTGIIRSCRDNEPLAGTTVTMKDATGKSQTATTSEDGTYKFELTNDVGQQQLFVSKELYKDNTSSVTTAETHDESDCLTDVFVNTEICLEKKLVIRPETVVTLYFDFDKSFLRDRAVEQLDSIYTVLHEDTTATIQISGYTDGLGTADYNKKLSDKRAKACADYLIQKGLDTGRISFESFGACCPVEMELINGRDNPDGRSRNRRALINITKE